MVKVPNLAKEIALEIERFEVKAKKYQGKANELREKLKTIFPKLETDKFVVDDGQNKVLSSTVFSTKLLTPDDRKTVWQ